MFFQFKKSLYKFVHLSSKLFNTYMVIRLFLTHAIDPCPWWFISIGFMLQFLSCFLMVISIFPFLWLRMSSASTIFLLQMLNSCWMRRSIFKNNYLNVVVTMESVIKNRISGLSLSLNSWIVSLKLPRGWGDLLLLLYQPMVHGSRKNINSLFFSASSGCHKTRSLNLCHFSIKIVYTNPQSPIVNHLSLNYMLASRVCHLRNWIPCNQGIWSQTIWTIRPSIRRLTVYIFWICFLDMISRAYNLSRRILITQPNLHDLMDSWMHAIWVFFFIFLFLRGVNCQRWYALSIYFDHLCFQCLDPSDRASPFQMV